MAAPLPVSGRTRLYPVVGSPIAQVQAPAAFNPWFAQCGVDALVVPLELAAADVVRCVRDLARSPSIGGVLVTVPYKKTLFGAVDKASERARRVGAVNAIRRDADGSLYGDLLDGLGFVRGLRAGGHEPRGMAVLIVGAGGAGAAIAAALLESGVASLALYDLEPAAAAALASQLQPLAPATAIRAQRELALAGHDLVVNATPLGMREADPLPFDLATLAPHTVVADIIMAPAWTRLLDRAAAHGCPTHPGRPMLDHQVPAYLDFFGLAPVGRQAAAALGEASSTFTPEHP